jgi:hypothetical protein
MTGFGLRSAASRTAKVRGRTSARSARRREPWPECTWNGGEHLERGVAMLVMIPGEEPGEVASRLAHIDKPPRRAGDVLGRREEGLDMGVVIGGRRPGEGGADLQPVEEPGRRVAAHLRAVVRERARELERRARPEPLAGQALIPEGLGQLAAEALGNQPGDNVATERVEQGIEDRKCQGSKVFR